MGQLAFLKMFLLVSIPTDVNDNRRHVHVFKKGTRHMRSIAKIWIEQNGQKCVEIAESELSTKDNEMIVSAIERHWEFINEQISKTFRGEKPKVKNIEKSPLMCKMNNGSVGVKKLEISSFRGKWQLS